METNKWQVPWQNRAHFEEAVLALAHIDRQKKAALEPVRKLAWQIKYRYNLMDGGLDRLCSMTCPDCRDNCCERAVIWYDFKDMIYLQFSTGRMPGCQILKIRGPGRDRCANLDMSGCRLPRSRRPFVCTWYFCPAQKGLPGAQVLSQIVMEIKGLRVRLEDEFCRITGGLRPLQNRAAP